VVCFAWYTCVMRHKDTNHCLVCQSETARSSYKYCSNSCQQEYQYLEFIKKWKEGGVQGIRNIGVVSRYVKRYLRRKYNNKCCKCGRSEKNPVTGLVPLVADHIDGNWRNNKEENLRLMCPNCDSLSPTYAALNKGGGRKHRIRSRRSRDRGKL